jgi:hypothetical protein
LFYLEQRTNASVSSGVSFDSDVARPVRFAGTSAAVRFISTVSETLAGTPAFQRF